MNALFIAVVILSVILFVMLCNSNKDRYDQLVRNAVRMFLTTHGRDDIPEGSLKSYKFQLPRPVYDMVNKYNQLDRNEQCQVQRKVQMLYYDKYGGNAPMTC